MIESFKLINNPVVVFNSVRKNKKIINMRK